MGKKARLDRRSFLAGVGGTAVVLPWLEVMGMPKASASTGGRPCRFIVSMTGSTLAPAMTPGTTGAGFSLPYVFESFEPIRDYVSLVSGMRVTTSDPPGPGGLRDTPGHGSMMVPQVTGRREDRGGPAGPTSDVLVADAWSGQTRFPALHYRVQPNAYLGGVGWLSARHAAHINGPVSSPRLAYDQLFTGFTPTGSGGSSAPQPSQRVDENRSVLDLVNRRSARLHSILGVWDRRRLERHFDEIRDLEGRIRGIDEGPGAPNSPPVRSGLCEPLLDPGGDPAIDLFPDLNGDLTGYSGEHERGRVLADLTQMAFTCDLTRVATYLIGYLTSSMSFQEILGVNFDAHSLTHSPAQTVLGQRGRQVRRDGSRWFVDQFAYLLKRLHDTPEGNGNLLDHTAAVLLWEHGSDGPHNRDNLIVTLAGVPHALRHSQHVRGNGRHPANALQTAMWAVGVREPLGEVAGVVDEMLV